MQPLPPAISSLTYSSPGNKLFFPEQGHLQLRTIPARPVEMPALSHLVDTEQWYYMCLVVVRMNTIVACYRAIVIYPVAPAHRGIYTYVGVPLV